MQPRSGSATEFTLHTLRDHPDRELRLADLAELAEGKFQIANIGLSLKLLLEHGLVVRTKEGVAAWWAISPAGLVPEMSAVPPSDANQRQHDKASEAQIPLNTAKPVAAKTAKPVAPTSPVSQTDAAKQFVLDTLHAVGQPMTLLELLDHRQHGDKHVSMRTLKLATFYLTHEGKLAQEDHGGQTRWSLK